MFIRLGVKCLAAAIALSVLTGVAAAQAGARYVRKWTGVYDSAVSGSDRAVSVASVVSDAVTLVTSHRAGGAGILVVYRTTRDGVRQWTTPLNVPGWSYGEDFHGTAKVGGDSDGNVYLAFNARNLTTDRLCPAVAKLNADGSLAWTHLYENIFDNNVNFEAMSDADFDPDGNVYMTGQSTNTTTQNGGGFTMRIAADESVQWKRTYTTGTSQVYGKSITRDSRGNAYVAYYAPTATGGTAHVGVYDGPTGTVRFAKPVVCGASTTDLEPNAVENSSQYTVVVGRGKAPDHNFAFATYFKPDGTVAFSKEYRNGSATATQRYDAVVITEHYLILGGSFGGAPGVVFLTPAGTTYANQWWGLGQGSFTRLLVDKAETLHAIGYGTQDDKTNADGIYMRWALADTGTHGDYPIQRIDPTFLQFGSFGATAGNDAANAIAINRYGEVYVAGTIDPGGEYIGSHPADSASYAFTTDLEQPPAPKADYYSMDEDGGPTTFSSILANDVYATEATFNLVDPYKTGITRNGSHVVMNADGSFTYTPRADYSGTDAFEYTLKHDGLYPAQHGVVWITVKSVNDAPVQVRPIVFVDETGAVNTGGHAATFFTDDYGPDQLTVSLVTAPNHGVLTIYDDEFWYKTNGQYFGHDSFVIRVTDSMGASTQAIADVYTPYISSLSPESVSVGAPTFTMRLSGKGIAPDEAVFWNSTKLDSTRISENAIDVVVPASFVATAGSAYVRISSPTNHYSRKFRILTLPNLKVTGTLTTDGSGHHAVVTLRNAGQSPSEAISVTAARIESKATTTTMPISLGSLAGGARQNMTLDFPTAGTPGTSVLLKVTVLNGSVSKTYSMRVTL